MPFAALSGMMDMFEEARIKTEKERMRIRAFFSIFTQCV